MTITSLIPRLINYGVVLFGYAGEPRAPAREVPRSIATIGAYSDLPCYTKYIGGA
jgi:hypothetical protein